MNKFTHREPADKAVGQSRAASVGGGGGWLHRTAARLCAHALAVVVMVVGWGGTARPLDRVCAARHGTASVERPRVALLPSRGVSARQTNPRQAGHPRRRQTKKLGGPCVSSSMDSGGDTNLRLLRALDMVGRGAARFTLLATTWQASLDRVSVARVCCVWLFRAALRSQASSSR